MPSFDSGIKDLCFPKDRAFFSSREAHVGSRGDRLYWKSHPKKTREMAAAVFLSSCPFQITPSGSLGRSSLPRKLGFLLLPAPYSGGLALGGAQNWTKLLRWTVRDGAGWGGAEGICSLWLPRKCDTPISLQGQERACPNPRGHSCLDGDCRPPGPAAWGHLWGADCRALDGKAGQAVGTASSVTLSI